MKKIRALVRCAACLAALGLHTATLRAQGFVVRGIVLLADSSTPAPAILIEVRGPGGAVAGGALSDDAGRFAVAVPGGGTFNVRALRVGYRASEATVIAGADAAPVRIVLGTETVRITTARITADDVCGIRSDSGHLIGTAWEEVRKALASSAASTHQTVNAQVVNWRSIRRADGIGTVVHTFTRDRFDSVARRGNAPGDTSVAVARAAGAPGGALDYFGPNAETLITDQFAAMHCFRLVAPPPGRGGWIGIAYRPARAGMSIVETSGTFWIDTATAALRVLEYRFTNGPTEFDSVNAGGTIEFDRLSSGRWIVRRWSMREPAAYAIRNVTARAVPSGARGPRGDGPRPTVKVSGGAVMSATSSGRELLLPSTSAWHGQFRRGGRPFASSGSTVEFVEAGLFAIADSSGAVEVSGVPPGKHTVLASTAAMRALALPPIRSQATIGASVTSVAPIDLPSDEEVLIDRCGRDTGTGSRAVVFGTGPVTQLYLSWIADGDRASARGKRWIADSVAGTFSQGSGDGAGVTAHEAGQWYVCGVPRSATMRVVAVWSDAAAAARTYARIAPDARVVEVVLPTDTPPARTKSP